MISRRLYLMLVLRILLIVSLSLFSGWLLYEKQLGFLAVVVLLLVLFLTYSLIELLNKTNRRLFYFFDAVRNEDSMLSFPDVPGDSFSNELNKRLNLVNRQIQQIKIENQLQEQYFQALLEHASTGIMTLDEKGFVLHCNSSVKRLLGVEVLTHVNQLERVNLKLFQAIKNIQPSDQKLVTFTNERTTIQLSVKANPFLSKGRNLRLLSVQDIRNELDEKELDSWMKLIRVLMHEIMNSITPITSLSESLSGYFMVDGRPVSPEEVTEKTISTTIRGLNVIKDQGAGLIQFVESYRKLTRVPKPDKKIFRLDELMMRLVGLFESLPNSGRVKLVVQINPPEMEIFADENLISQVLLNLAKNALEANGQNQDGRIVISAGYGADHRQEIRVADNGPGIPEEIIEQVFVPFFTTRENGSGIGLSLSKQIMRIHGGSLQVRSVPNKETVFSLGF